MIRPITIRLLRSKDIKTIPSTFDAGVFHKKLQAIFISRKPLQEITKIRKALPEGSPQIRHQKYLLLLLEGYYHTKDKNNNIASKAFQAAGHQGDITVHLLQKQLLAEKSLTYDKFLQIYLDGALSQVHQPAYIKLNRADTITNDIQSRLHAGALMLSKEEPVLASQFFSQAKDLYTKHEHQVTGILSPINIIASLEAHGVDAPQHAGDLIRAGIGQIKKSSFF